LEIVLAARIDTLKIYSFLDFSLDTSFMVSCRWPTALPGSDRALMLRLRGPRGAPPERSLFTILDMATRQFVDSFVISDGLPSPMQAWTFDVSEDGRMLYAIGHDNVVPFVAGFSLNGRQLEFRTLLSSVYGHCRLSPDQRELWVTDPGPPPTIGPSWPGHILILDAMTGVIKDTIHTRGLDQVYPDIRWRVDDIQFVPGSNKAYVNCLYRGPILVIDTKSKEITKHLLHDEGRSADAIVALPRY
jgi:hypothetical protein